MMTRLLETVRGLVDYELADARSIHGEYFHSPHEGYGVLAEELYETNAETEDVCWKEKMLLRALHKDNLPLLVHTLEAMQESATRAACEYIQVAAMAKKMRESVEKLNE